jgi:hypothetical protein
LLKTTKKKTPSHPAHADSGDGFIAFEKGDDDCFSLFYDRGCGTGNGSGFPTRNSCHDKVENDMRVVHEEYRLLPKDVYSKFVENMIIVCVDIICLRKSDNKVLLFYRRDKPASNIWWFPGTV